MQEEKEEADKFSGYASAEQEKEDHDPFVMPLANSQVSIKLWVLTMAEFLVGHLILKKKKRVLIIIFSPSF